MARRAASPAPELPGLKPLRLLGSGGFSDVYLYEQDLPRRQVAVKVLSAESLSDAARSAFMAEANLMAQLSAHPYIVTIYTADVSADGRPYIVMEYVSGPTLAQQYRLRPFTVADALRTGIRLSSAVATAHAAGILHRDIKPANVLSTDYGWPALADFGISSAMGPDGEHVHGADGPVGLSIPWSPPEMFEDSPQPDVRSDVFSLAATIYTVLAARTPFEAAAGPNSSVDVIARIERGRAEPLGRADVPPSLVAVIARGLARRREDRFANAVDFARALQRIEMELDYAPTAIDVPNLLVAEPVSEDSDEAAATRVRSLPSVSAQGSQAPQTPQAPPASGGPGGPAHDATVIRAIAPVVPARDDDDDRTRVRGIATAAPAGPARLRADAQSAGGAPAADARPASPGGDDSPPSGAPGRRSRLLLLVGGILAVLVAAGVVAGIVFAPRDEAPPVQRPSDGAIDVSGVPAPTAGAITPNEDGTEATFTWQNPDERDGDRYLVRRSDREASERPLLLDRPEVVLDDVNPEGELCLNIQINRAGRLSAEPLRMCR